MAVKKKRKVSNVARITSMLRKAWLWSDVRKEAIKIANGHCEDCGCEFTKENKLQVHHTIPANVTILAKKICEALFPPVETLDVLCKRCHHDHEKRGI